MGTSRAGSAHVSDELMRPKMVQRPLYLSPRSTANELTSGVERKTENASKIPIETTELETDLIGANRTLADYLRTKDRASWQTVCLESTDRDESDWTVIRNCVRYSGHFQVGVTDTR